MHGLENESRKSKRKIMRELTVIVPVYNEARVLQRFHDALSAALGPLEPTLRWRVLYVADPGSDDTEAQLEALTQRDPHAAALVMSRRFGHQAALIAGMDHTPGGAVAMMDGDLQHPPELLPKMLAKLDEGYQVVYTVREAGEGVSTARRGFSDLFYAWINRISDTPIRPNSADFRLISETVLRVFQTQMRERNQFLRGLFVWVGFRQAAVSFHVKPRVGGTSKYRVRDLGSFALRGLMSFSKAPLHFAAVLGVLIALAGFVLGLVQIAAYLTSNRDVPGWATLFATTVFLGGIQLLCLGVIGEYIGAIFDEVKARPHYIVNRTLSSDISGLAARSGEATLPGHEGGRQP